MTKALVNELIMAQMQRRSKRARAMPINFADDAMISADDLAYFRRRAAMERELAYGSDIQIVASIHGRLARQYEALIDQLKSGSLSAPRAWLVRSEDRSLWHQDWNNSASPAKFDRRLFSSMMTVHNSTPVGGAEKPKGSI